MSHSFERTEYLVVGAVLAGTLAVHYLLGLGLLPSLLLTVFAVLVGVFAIVPGTWRTLYRETGIGVTAWLLAAVIVLVGVATSYRLGDPQLVSEGVAGHRGSLTVYGWASIGFLASSVGIAVAAGHVRRFRRIRRASTMPAADVEDGIVAVEGRIDPENKTVRGPLSDRETVWHRTATERPAVFDGSSEIEQDTVGDRFYVTDGSGRLLVLLGRIDQHVAVEFARSDTADEGDERRREWRYEPNDPVTVVGQVSDVSRAEYPEPVVVGLDGPVLLARGTIDDLSFWAARRTIVGGAIAILGGGLSFLVMLLAGGSI